MTPFLHVALLTSATKKKKKENKTKGEREGEISTFNFHATWRNGYFSLFYFRIS